jgi:hypothetical protein
VGEAAAWMPTGSFWFFSSSTRQHAGPTARQQRTPQARGCRAVGWRRGRDGTGRGDGGGDDGGRGPLGWIASKLARGGGRDGIGEGGEKALTGADDAGGTTSTTAEGAAMMMMISWR